MIVEECDDFYWILREVLSIVDVWIEIKIK